MLMVIPEGKIIDIRRLRELVPNVPITTSPASDAIHWLKEPVCVLTQVQSMTQINMDALRHSQTSGFVPVKVYDRDDVKMHANGVLWVATAEKVDVNKYEDVFTVVKIPLKEDVWVKEEKENEK